MINYVFNRPYCSPASGTVSACSSEIAILMVHRLHGYCSNTTVTSFTQKTGWGGASRVVTITYDEDGVVNEDSDDEDGEW